MRLRHIDFLRGIAVILVLFRHHAFINNTHNAGWIGVDLFFVLSGFLITGILLDTVNQKRYFQNFYWRRILRIFPLYYAILMVFYRACCIWITGVLSSEINYCPILVLALPAKLAVALWIAFHKYCRAFLVAGY